MLDQQQRITELLTRVTSLNEALAVGDERGKADVHERAVQVAEYSELVQRLKEEMLRMQDEQAEARREMAATVDTLVSDMKAQMATHERRVSELHQQRKRDEEEQRKEPAALRWYSRFAACRSWLTHCGQQATRVCGGREDGGMGG